MNRIEFSWIQILNSLRNSNGTDDSDYTRVSIVISRWLASTETVILIAAIGLRYREIVAPARYDDLLRFRFFIVFILFPLSRVLLGNTNPD